MSISINGQSSCVPPGFRFHPTEEELLNYYLRKKVASEKIDLDVIGDVDLNKLEPWDIQEKCRIGSTPQNDWYFFSHKDKKYPTGTRTNRATAAGFWKATGRDKVIYTSIKRLGMRKTLVFYKGRAPHGQKSDWIMHEYRLDDQTEPISASCLIGDMSAQEDGWVVCRVFKKKTHQKSTDSPNNCSSSITGGDGGLDQILQYMGRSCKQETDAITNLRYFQSMEAILGAGSGGFMKLPSLESSPLSTDIPPNPEHQIETYSMDGVSTDLSDLDRLVATHLNGQSEVSRELDCFEDLGLGNSQLIGAHEYYHHQNNIDSGGDDLWSFNGTTH